MAHQTFASAVRPSLKKYDQFANATSIVIRVWAGAHRRMSLLISALMFLANVAVVIGLVFRVSFLN